MTETNFEGPLSVGDVTGIPNTDTRGFVRLSKRVIIGQAQPRQVVTISPDSVVTGFGFVPTSAFTGTDPVSALSVNFGTSADPNQHGVVTVSAATRYTEQVAAFVSGATFDDGGTIVVTISAVSTTTFTGGGGRAFIHYVTHREDRP